MNNEMHLMQMHLKQTREKVAKSPQCLISLCSVKKYVTNLTPAFLRSMISLRETLAVNQANGCWL